MKFSGGSLFYALTIAVVIGLVSSAVLLSAHFSRMSFLRNNLRDAVIRNAHSGLELLMSTSEIVPPGTPEETDLFGEGSDSVKLLRKPWGAFEIAISEAHTQHETFTLAAITGWQPSVNDKTALILAGLDQPLSVCGKTIIKGTAFLPKSGVQRAYIEGSSFLGDKLIDGEIKPADRFLPPVNMDLLKRIDSLYTYSPSPGDSVIAPQDIFQMDSVSCPFSGKKLCIYSPAKIRLAGQVISGQVCVISRKQIDVEKDCHLSNVILIAPVIHLAEGTEGTLQAFARDTLVAGEKVLLHFPSVLAVVANELSPGAARLFVAKGAHIYGQLLGERVNEGFQKYTLVDLEPGATLTGQLVSGDMVNLKGKVEGEVICSEFRLITNSGVYDNHLLNAEIDRTKLPKEYAGSLVLKNKEDKQRVIEWIK